MGLWYSKDSRFELIAYSDAYHAGCNDDCKSTSRGIQFLGDKLVSWSSKKQDFTTMPTAEVEYVSLSACCAQVIWMRTQLLDYRFRYTKIPMYCDSKSEIAISCNPIQHSRTKHISIRYHFIKEHTEKCTIELYFVGTKYQLADLFTKALPKERCSAVYLQQFWKIVIKKPDTKDTIIFNLDSQEIVYIMDIREAKVIEMEKLDDKIEKEKKDDDVERTDEVVKEKDNDEDLKLTYKEQEMISKEFATYGPTMIEELFRKHMQTITLNLYPTTSSSTTDLQQQIYLNMKTKPQDQAADLELWEILKAKFKKP
ncbi:hypothetical protein Tco_0256026 [Tanacetum coccineum]